jgi:hypothetical protein
MSDEKRRTELHNSWSNLPFSQKRKVRRNQSSDVGLSQPLQSKKEQQNTQDEKNQS